MNYQCYSFYQLSLDQLYAVMALRQEVFVVEQDCPYLDADGLDQASYHLLGFDDQERLVAYTRLCPKGLSYTDYVSIGRVITSARIRGKGQGKYLMEASVKKCKEIFGAIPIKISAQAHLDKFYQSLGFEPVGESYLEDGIPHIGMIRK